MIILYRDISDCTFKSLPILSKAEMSDGQVILFAITLKEIQPDPETEVKLIYLN